MDEETEERIEKLEAENRGLKEELDAMHNELSWLKDELERLRRELPTQEVMGEVYEALRLREGR